MPELSIRERAAKTMAPTGTTTSRRETIMIGPQETRDTSNRHLVISEGSRRPQENSVEVGESSKRSDIPAKLGSIARRFFYRIDGMPRPPASSQGAPTWVDEQ